jgi:trimeric autotransporter adhesin
MKKVICFILLLIWWPSLVQAELGVSRIKEVSPRYLTEMNGVFFFSAYDTVNGSALWKSDGTRSGTVVVKKFEAGTYQASPPGKKLKVSPKGGGGGAPTPRGLLNVGGTLYFCAYEITSGWELWKSNGTTAGTTMVKDIYSGSSDGVSDYCHLASIGSTVFFDGTDTSDNGPALWKTDGTAVNTVMVKDVQPVPGSNGGRPEHLFVMNNTLYFIGNDAVHGDQWWKSDGTEGGTTRVTDLANGVYISSDIENPVILGDYFYFQGNDGINGYELWRSDGTGAGTTLVKNINETPYVPNVSGDSYPFYLTLVSGTIFFRADDDIHGRELWKSDGTPGNTVLVKDIHPGTDTSFEPYNLTDVNGTLYFSADDGSNGTELWKSDGTLDGTAMVKDINPGLGNSWPRDFIAFDGEIYFSAENVTNGTELWKTNGTVGNATLVKDIIPGSDSSWPGDFLVMNDALLFSATYNNSLPEGEGDALFRYGESQNEFFWPLFLPGIIVPHK